MKVSQIMTRPVETCRAAESLAAAAHRLWEHDCGCVPVVDERSRVVAMLTDRDICMAAYLQGKTLHEIPVSTAMSRSLTFCRPTDTLGAAEKLMQASQVRRLPVVDREGRLVGLLSLCDIAREAARHAGEATEEEAGHTLARICETPYLAPAARGPMLRPAGMLPRVEAAAGRR